MIESGHTNIFGGNAMKKLLVTTTIAVAMSFSTPGVPSLNQSPAAVANAATVYNNQTAVNQKADQLIQSAKSLIGKSEYSRTEYKPTYPYKFSCATLLMYIFKENGVDLATYNENYMMKQGTYVSKDQLQKGDLVFFDANPSDSEPTDHVAMYIGDNKVIHMADPIQNIVITDMASKPYYTDNYVTARRVLPSLLSANPATKGDKIVETSYYTMDKAVMGSINDEQSMKFTGPGFVNYVYKTNGVNLGTTALNEMIKKGTTVSKQNLKKGDLIFFNSVKGSSNPSLVAIYAGDHRIIVPNSKGILTRVLFVDFYQQHYITAKRVFSETVTQAAAEDTSAESTDSQTPTKADEIVDFASSLTGKARFGYTYNEDSLIFTSAGFTYYVYKQVGIDLKSKLASSQSAVGQTVSKSNLQKGDLIFFSINNSGSKIAQTGIYVGENQFISLSTAGPVVKQSLNTEWALKNYVLAKRVL